MSPRSLLLGFAAVLTGCAASSPKPPSVADFRGGPMPPEVAAKIARMRKGP